VKNYAIYIYLIELIFVTIFCWISGNRSAM